MFKKKEMIIIMIACSLKERGDRVIKKILMMILKIKV